MSEEFVVLGSLGATFGVKAWLKVNSYTEPKANILDFPSWYISKDGNDWKEVMLDDGKVHSNKFVVKLSEVDDMDEAKLLTGSKIAVKRHSLTELGEGEHYWCDLEGLSLINLSGEFLGTVLSVNNFGANDVFEIETEAKKTIYVPYIKDGVVKEILFDEKKIIVDWERSFNEG